MSCNLEAASVEELSRQLDGTVEVTGVTWAGTQQAYTDFIDRHGLTFVNVDDTFGELFSRFGVVSQPAWVLLEPNGDATTRVGAPSADDVAILLAD